MIARDALIHLLDADPAVAAIVGDHIYPHWAPQGVPKSQPYLVVLQVNATRPHHMLGPSGLVEARVQVDAFADGFRAVEDLARAVRLALDGFIGSVLADGETLTLQQCHLDNEIHDIESWDPYAEAPERSRVTQDYLCAHHE